MPLDCNDGAALRVAPVKGPDPKLRNEFCRQVSCAYRKPRLAHYGSPHRARVTATQPHCILLISNVLLVLARHNRYSVAIEEAYAMTLYISEHAEDSSVSRIRSFHCHRINSP